jgi:Helix-turn-helix domain
MELKMTIPEASRLEVMKRKERKEISLKKASEEIGLSYKQTKRIWKRYLSKGPAGLLSKKRGKISNNQLCEKLKEEAVSIIKYKYFDYGPTLAREKLEEKHNLRLGKETLRQLMIKEGLWKAKKTKHKKVHPRRTRRSRYGEMQQIDGSYEYWFEERGEKCCLLVSVDDATSAITGLMFCKTETTEDYLTLLKAYIAKHGRPVSFYSDKHSVFRVNNKKKSEGTFSTRFQEVLKALDIELICAHSPQAKGRVERANGVLQDRLIKELREQKINNIEEGNAYLEEFRLMYNKKFAVEAADVENAHREILSQHKDEKLWMKKEERTLSRDLSFQYKTEIYQIKTNYKNRLYGKKVLIHESEGEVKMVLQNGNELDYQKWKEKISEPTKILDVKELESSWKTIKRKPGRKHPWR